MTNETSTPYDEALDFSQVPDDAVNEFYRQAELCLQGTIQVAIAADSRATTSTGIFGAATAALLVLAGNLASKDSPPTPLILAVVSGSFLLLVAAILSARAARPIDFHVVGYQPKLLYDAATSEKNIKLEAASDIQLRIEKNSEALRKSGRALSSGRLISLLSVPVAIVSFYLSTHWHLCQHCLP